MICWVLVGISYISRRHLVCIVVMFPKSYKVQVSHCGIGQIAHETLDFNTKLSPFIFCFKLRTSLSNHCYFLLKIQIENCHSISNSDLRLSPVLSLFKSGHSLFFSQDHHRDIMWSLFDKFFSSAVDLLL